MPSNHLIFCRPLLLLPSIFPSIRVFSNESALRIRWPKYWSFSFSICPSNEYSGLISFRMDWLDLLTVQGTLKSLLQHHSSKSSILWHSATPISPMPRAFSTSASRSLPISQLFPSGGQSIGVSASASVLPMNIQDRFPLGLTGWLFCRLRDSQESSPTPVL